ncbi:hypothetical protein BCR33DRAFT_714305 [Rhizoclosmatium globosum]|uniref:MYND-type domain-containing protein n=1 Tax=Rhizoclosmatium globosum TaxID=329046 RepID=A0A1Y2CND1_9FUNG|nr:hypothetical protein BCR33DRAFT_714305 [Rhizoclosmatium globosum]|eukprot:ORY48541.1 hypothetical protein BCR33DRAFT_714305 [Rhizoclosmatium globosum]
MMTHLTSLDLLNLPLPLKSHLSTFDIGASKDHVVCKAAIEFLVDSLTPGKLLLRATETIDSTSSTDVTPYESLFTDLNTAIPFRWNSQAFYIYQQCTALLESEKVSETRTLVINTVVKINSSTKIKGRINPLKDNCLFFYLGSLLQGYTVAPTPTDFEFVNTLEKGNDEHEYYRAIGSYLSYLLTVLQGNPAPRKLYTSMSRFKSLSPTLLETTKVFHIYQTVSMHESVFGEKGWMEFIAMDIKRATQDAFEDFPDEYGGGLVEERKRFPMGHECNQCHVKRSVEGVSLRQCERCQAVYYCSSECQRAAWKDSRHKRYCRDVGVFRVGDVVRLFGLRKEDGEEEDLNSTVGDIVWREDPAGNVWSVFCLEKERRFVFIKKEKMRLLVTREEVIDLCEQMGETPSFDTEELS